jgi:hypothetical protein
MDEQTQIEVADDTVMPSTVESPPAESPTMIASVEELLAWRSAPTMKPGDSFVYFASSSSLMRIRSRDLAADAVGKAALDLWRAGRVQLTQAKIGDGHYRYIATACEAEPVRDPVVVQPVRTRTKVVQV